MKSDDGRVVSNFIVQALRNEDITIFGDGSQTRSFCYIDDMVKGIVNTMDLEDFTGPINLGNPIEYTIKELAEKIIKMTNSGSKVKFSQLPDDDPTRRKPDISMAKEKLSWEPGIDIDQGLKKTIEFFKNIIDE
jgi:UDP-glucuronate decarboxylase